MGKADATRAREFGYKNRRSVCPRLTDLSTSNEVVIGSYSAVLAIGRQVFNLDGQDRGSCAIRERRHL